MRTFLRLHQPPTIEGNVCTIQLRIVSWRDGGVDPSPATISDEIRADLEPKLRKSVSDSLGPDFEVRQLTFSIHAAEVLMMVATTHAAACSYERLEKTLASLTEQLRSLLTWTLAGRIGKAAVTGHWLPEPPLIRLQFETSDTKTRPLQWLQQPLSVLLLGTLFGSLLIPYLNDLSNRNRLRHEERIKIALKIVEETRETDRRMSSLAEYLVLFRKDHPNRPASKENLKKEQQDARKAFNDMYLAFNTQAWWWFWSVKSESSLSALATPAEAQKIALLARQYSDALLEGTAEIGRLWDRFLKDSYDPADPQNDVLIKEATENLAKARKHRSEVALQMARVFATKN
jgi:hypothetical protein